MGWFSRMWTKVKGAAPLEMTLVQSVAAPGYAYAGSAIEPDECYIELYVESLRLTKARRFATRFNGVVYSFASLAQQGQPNADLAAVSKPAKLAELDATSLDRVITVSKKMLGAVPWRGGTFSLELGLFSVKAGNLLTPVLDYVTRVSSAAGASFVGAVKPFLPLITEGMDLIAGQQADTEIEVGIDTDMDLRTSGIHAIVAAPKGSFDPKALSVDPTDNKLLLNGKPLQFGYCVFAVRRVDEKADYGEIPELKEKYDALMAAIRANKQADAKDALAAFRLATIASPDLITSDAAKLVQKAEAKMKAAFPSGGISKAVRPAENETLADIGLYQ